MNVTLNTASLNKNNINNKNNTKQFKQQSFTSNPILKSPDIAAEVMKESSLFDPLLKVYDSFTDGIAKHFTSKVVNSKPIIGLASMLKNSDNLFQHCLTIGSAITSGLYMQKTLTNDKLDKDRKKTLALNQGLTLAVSTAGAYGLDKYIKNWWGKLTERFTANLLGDNHFVDNFHECNKAIAEENNKLIATAKDSKKTPLLKEAKKLEEFVKEHNNYKALNEKEAKELIGKIKGMSVLRTMIVFGFVYRFFVPVVVTKPSNILCEKYLAYKKAKDEQKNLTA